MTLDPHSKYPSTRSYVLKLHRDSLPQRGEIDSLKTDWAWSREWKRRRWGCLSSSSRRRRLRVPRRAAPRKPV